MNEETLLEKALNFQVNFKKGRRELKDQDLELVEAWLKGVIGFKQLSMAVGLKGSNVYNYIARCIKALYLKGRIILPS